jgi:hypothetical protein
LKGVMQPLLGLVEQTLGGIERLCLALGVLADPLQVLPRCCEFSDQRRSRLRDLTCGHTTHDEHDHERRGNRYDDSAEQINIQLQNALENCPIRKCQESCRQGSLATR